MLLLSQIEKTAADVLRGDLLELLVVNGNGIIIS